MKHDKVILMEHYFKESLENCGNIPEILEEQRRQATVSSRTITGTSNSTLTHLSQSARSFYDFSSMLTQTFNKNPSALVTIPPTFSSKIPALDTAKLLECFAELRPVVIIPSKKRPPSSSEKPFSEWQVHESEINNLIKKYATEGHRLLVSQDFKQALMQLKRADMLMNALAQRDLSKIEGDQLLFIKANLGIVFYKIGLLQESFSYFCVCLANLKRAKKSGGVLTFSQKHSHISASTIKKRSYSQLPSTAEHADYMQSLAIKLKAKKLKGEILLQTCIVLSEQGNHQDALVAGNKASKLHLSYMVDTLTICYHLLLQAISDYESKAYPAKRGHSATSRISKEGSSTGPASAASTASYSIFEGDFAQEILLNSETQLPPAQSPKERISYLEKIVPIIKEIMKRTSDLQGTHVSLSKVKILEILGRLINQQAGFQPTSPTSTSPVSLYERANLEHLFSAITSRNHWILKTNILSLLQLKSVQLEDTMISKTTIENEVTLDAMLNKISHLCVSFYCISTETRFLSDQKKNAPGGGGGSQLLTQQQQSGKYAKFLQNLNYQVTESENWLSRSLEIAYLFLPHDIPLVGQIVSVHNKFHNVNKIVIHEDDRENQETDRSRDDDNIHLKQSCYPPSLNYISASEYASPLTTLQGGSKSNFFIPLVRKIKPYNSSTNHTDQSAENTTKVSVEEEKIALLYRTQLLQDSSPIEQKPTEQQLLLQQQQQFNKKSGELIANLNKKSNSMPVPAYSSKDRLNQEGGGITLILPPQVLKPQGIASMSPVSLASRHIGATQASPSGVSSGFTNPQTGSNSNGLMLKHNQNDKQAPFISRGASPAQQNPLIVTKKNSAPQAIPSYKTTPLPTPVSQIAPTTVLTPKTLYISQRPTSDVTQLQWLSRTVDILPRSEDTKTPVRSNGHQKVSMIGEEEEAPRLQQQKQLSLEDFHDRGGGVEHNSFKDINFCHISSAAVAATQSEIDSLLMHQRLHPSPLASQQQQRSHIGSRRPSEKSSGSQIDKNNYSSYLQVSTQNQLQLQQQQSLKPRQSAGMGQSSPNQTAISSRQNVLAPTIMGSHQTPSEVNPSQMKKKRVLSLQESVPPSTSSITQSKYKQFVETPPAHQQHFFTSTLGAVSNGTPHGQNSSGDRWKQPANSFLVSSQSQYLQQLQEVKKSQQKPVMLDRKYRTIDTSTLSSSVTPNNSSFTNSSGERVLLSEMSYPQSAKNSTTSSTAVTQRHHLQQTFLSSEQSFEVKRKSSLGLPTSKQYLQLSSAARASSLNKSQNQVKPSSAKPLSSQAQNSSFSGTTADRGTVQSQPGATASATRQHGSKQQSVLSNTCGSSCDVQLQHVTPTQQSMKNNFIHDSILNEIFEVNNVSLGSHQTNVPSLQLLSSQGTRRTNSFTGLFDTQYVTPSVQHHPVFQLQPSPSWQAQQQLIYNHQQQNFHSSINTSQILSHSMDTKRPNSKENVQRSSSQKNQQSQQQQHPMNKRNNLDIQVSSQAPLSINTSSFLAEQVGSKSSRGSSTTTSSYFPNDYLSLLSKMGSHSTKSSSQQSPSHNILLLKPSIVVDHHHQPVYASMTTRYSTPKSHQGTSTATTATTTAANNDKKLNMLRKFRSTASKVPNDLLKKK